MSCRENDLEKIKMALNENPIINFLNDGTLTPVDGKPKKNMKVYYSPKEVKPKWHIDINNFS